MPSIPQPSHLPQRCLDLYDSAVADLGANLAGFSVLDLCADNLPDVSLADLKAAIVASGITRIASPMIQAQIATYTQADPIGGAS